jgi:hypothetical protein
MVLSDSPIATNSPEWIINEHAGHVANIEHLYNVVNDRDMTYPNPAKMRVGKRIVVCCDGYERRGPFDNTKLTGTITLVRGKMGSR